MDIQRTLIINHSRSNQIKHKLLWGFFTVMGELILISLVRNKSVSLNALQIIVIFVCIPIVMHVLISGFRKLLYLSAPSNPTK